MELLGQDNLAIINRNEAIDGLKNLECIIISNIRLYFQQKVQSSISNSSNLQDNNVEQSKLFSFIETEIAILEKGLKKDLILDSIGNNGEIDEKDMDFLKEALFKKLLTVGIIKSKLEEGFLKISELILTEILDFSYFEKIKILTDKEIKNLDILTLKNLKTRLNELNDKQKQILAYIYEQSKSENFKKLEEILRKKNDYLNFSEEEHLDSCFLGKYLRDLGVKNSFMLDYIQDLLKKDGLLKYGDKSILEYLLKEGELNITNNFDFIVKNSILVIANKAYNQIMSLTSLLELEESDLDYFKLSAYYKCLAYSIKEKLLNTDKLIKLEKVLKKFSINNLEDFVNKYYDSSLFENYLQKYLEKHGITKYYVLQKLECYFSLHLSLDEKDKLLLVMQKLHESGEITFQEVREGLEKSMNYNKEYVSDIEKWQIINEILQKLITF